MATEYVVAILAVSAVVALVGLWRAAHSRSYATWSIGFGGLLVFVVTFLVAAAPQINRPPETEAEAFYRTRFEAAELERKSIAAQLAKVNEAAERVDAAVKRASQAVRERDTAQVALDRSVSEVRSLQSEIERETARRQRSDGRLTDAEADKAKLAENIRTLEEKVRTQEMAITAQRTAREQADAALAWSKWQLSASAARRRIVEARSKRLEDRLGSTELEIASLRNQHALLASRRPSKVDEKARALLRQIETKFDTALYSIVPRHDIDFFAGLSGNYYSVTFRRAADQKAFEFTNVEPPLISDEQAFLEAAAAFAREMVTTLESSIELGLYVRGSADTRPIRNQPDPTKLEPFRTFYPHARLGPDKYAAERDVDVKQIALPLRNEDLPNLRATFLAARLNNQLELSGVKSRFGILDQEPAVTFREGEGVKLEPELFLFIPER